MWGCFLTFMHWRKFEEDPLWIPRDVSSPVLLFPCDLQLFQPPETSISISSALESTRICLGSSLPVDTVRWQGLISLLLSGQFVTSLVLSHCNKNLKQLMDSVTAPCNFLRWTSVTTPYYSSVLFRKKRKIHPWGVRACQPKKHEKKVGGG